MSVTNKLKLQILITTAIAACDPLLRKHIIEDCGLSVSSLRYGHAEIISFNDKTIIAVEFVIDGKAYNRECSIGGTVSFYHNAEHFLIAITHINGSSVSDSDGEAFVKLFPLGEAYNEVNNAIKEALDAAEDSSIDPTLN